MTKRGALILAALGIVLIGFGLAPWTVARPTIDRTVKAAIQRATGLAVTIEGEAHVALLPKPRIVLHAVALSSPDQTTRVAAPRLRADLKLLPLALGRLEVDSIDLVAPQIDVQASGPSGTAQPWLDRLGGLLAGPRDTPRIVVLQGALFARDGPTIVSTLRDMNVVVAAREPGAPFSIAGSVLWRGENADVTAQWALPGGLGSDEVSTRLRSGPVNLKFLGKRNAAASDRIEGMLDIEAPSLARALAWIGESNPLAVVNAPARLSGDIAWSPAKISVPSVEISLNEDKFDGALDIRPGANGHWGLSGTLAGVKLDIDRLVERIDVDRLLTPGEGGRASLNLAAISQREVDLRVSLERVTAAEASLGNLALQLMISSGRIDANLLRASAYKGALKGRFQVAQQADGETLDYKASGSVEKLDLAAASADLGAGRKYSGSAFSQFQVEGAGTTLAEVARNLSGRASLVVRQGEFGGLALAELVRRAERQPLSLLLGLRTGRTSFDLASFAGQISQGTLDLLEGQMTGPGFKLALAGRIALAERSFALSGALAGPNGGAMLPFDVTGPWSNPGLRTDAEALIRRSEPPARLFER